MGIRATILISESRVSTAPNPLTPVQEAAWRLEAVGFKILSLGRLGVSVMAERSVYQNALGLDIPRDREIELTIESPMAPLVGIVSKLTLARTALN